MREKGDNLSREESKKSRFALLFDVVPDHSLLNRIFVLIYVLFHVEMKSLKLLISVSFDRRPADEKSKLVTSKL